MSVPFVVKNENSIATDPKTSKGLNKQLLIIILVIIGILVIGGYLFLSQKKVASSTRASAFVSDRDTRAQELTKKITGFNWPNIPANLNGSEKQMLAALLLTYSEGSAVFNPEVGTVLLNSAAVKKLKLEKLSTDNKKENYQKLFNFLETIEKNYQEKGLIPAKTHLDRLAFLKTYFSKNLPQQKYKIPDEAKDISSGIKVAANQEDYGKILLSRFNNWLTYADVVK